MRYLTLLILLFILNPSVYSQVDDVSLCFANLQKERRELSKKVASASGSEKAKILKTMLDRGMWEQAYPLIQQGMSLDANDKSILLAYYSLLNNNYKESEREIAKAIKSSPNKVEAQKIHIQLLIEAWKLDEAVKKCEELEKKYPSDLELSLLKGRTLLLQRKYDEVTALVSLLHKKFPNQGRVYQLEADIYFWDRRPDEAEPLLIKSLELDPFNADARFSYGYAIWRRIDATQLNQMAAQWELALALNPLHFQTHWHWGNGHTNLTFIDYADLDEVAIRAALSAADSLFTLNRIEEAIELTRQVEKAYPQSVLPLMHRGSLWYGDFDHPNRSQRLDSALVLFQDILNRKPHYGPAHNGLSAVIKSKRIPYLSTYDSITTVLRKAKIDDSGSFEKIFPDVGYYPGTIAKAMAWNQLNTAIVYFPFLIKQNEKFLIPPLHKDLAIVMNRPSFRNTTTFDNRQWMDIRGVGSGAAAIEYVERGAWQERNVILHEYVHLFHDRVLTDHQNRRIRALYYSAMENNRTLDYYSENNEHEYLAQTYPAYWEPMKVHPLDFKSMNTTSALIAKDPEMYYFLDSLINNERRYLKGEKEAMASNWAQVYINLSRQYRNDPAKAILVLDTALQYDSNYQPALLAKAALQLRLKDTEGALRSIQSSEKIDDQYAPTYQSYAEWVKQTETDPSVSLQKQVEWLKKALALENDFQTKAGMAIALRQLYSDHAKIKEAIAEMEAYIGYGSEISTYLRDRKDDAKMFVAYRQALSGDRKPLETMDRLVKLKPQNYNFSMNYADALAANGDYTQAIALMQQVQRIFEANRSRRPDFDLRIAEYYQAAGKADSAVVFYANSKKEAGQLTPIDAQRLYRLSILLNTGDEIPVTGEMKYPEHSIAFMASTYFTQGLQKEKAGDKASAISLYRKALSLDPYLQPADKALQHLLH
jgi:predicted Zn-dependent protease